MVFQTLRELTPTQTKICQLGTGSQMFQFSMFLTSYYSKIKFMLTMDTYHFLDYSSTYVDFLQAKFLPNQTIVRNGSKYRSNKSKDAPISLCVYIFSPSQLRSLATVANFSKAAHAVICYRSNNHERFSVIYLCVMCNTPIPFLFLST